MSCFAFRELSLGILTTSLGCTPSSPREAILCPVDAEADECEEEEEDDDDNEDDKISLHLVVRWEKLYGDMNWFSIVRC